MERITDLAGLKQQIAILEQKREAEKDAISNEVADFLESLKPVNLLKGLFHSVKESPDLKSDLLRGAVGLGTGFLTNKLLLGKLHGPLKAVLGMILPGLLTSAAVKLPIDGVKHKGISMLTNFLKSIKIKTEGGIEKQHETGESHL